jgi:hypothetical protein
MTTSESERDTGNPVQFKSDTTRKVFDSLVDFFIEDYMVKKYISEKSGWRTLAEIADKSHISTSALYGKHSTLGQVFDEPVRRGLIETRIFPGERGRGGEVMRLRIAYEKDPIRELVSRKIRFGRDAKVPHPPSSDPLEEKFLTVLSESPLFSTLDKDQIRKIVQLSDKLSFSQNEFIVHEGDIAAGFFLIMDGQVEVKQRGKSIRRMGRCQFFGETTLVENEPRSADVIAVEPTKCLRLSAIQLKELVNLDPQVAVKILEEIVKRNRGITSASLTNDEQNS